LQNWFQKSHIYPIVATALILITAVWVTAQWIVSSERENQSDKAKSEATHLASVFEQQTLQTLNYADTYLKSVRREFYRGGVRAVTSMIEELPPDFSSVSHITIIDREGIPVLVSGYAIKPGTNARDREYFISQKQRSGDQIYFSLPKKGRNSGLLTVRMVRRLVKPDGSFDGVIFAAIIADNITAFFNKLNLGPNSSATLVGDDRKIRARSSYGRLGPGQDISGSRIWKELSISPVGLYRQTSVVDNVARFYAYRHLEDYPLITAIGVSTEDLMEQVQQFSLQIYAIASLLSAVILVMSLLIYREIQTGQNMVRARILTNMSHELRTPMNAILGFAQMLKFNTNEALTPKQKSSVDHILKGGNHLLELIDQVLELNKMEAGKLAFNMDNTSAQAVIDESLFLIRARAEDAGIEIINHTAGEKLPMLWTDGTRLTQVLLNLLSNAVKYNRKGGTVTLTHEQLSEQLLRISVTDTGEGIPVGKQGDLFKLFERLGREVGEIEGTGIGLTIAKQMIELMGGQIGFESARGRGSTFWLDIPVSDDQTNDKEDMTPFTLNSRLTDEDPSHRILYIEDNPDNMRLMEVIIEQINNTSLLLAYNAEQGIDLARQEIPDLILMDINLPGMNGVEALKILHNTEETNHIPVIAVTSAALPIEIESGLKAGFVDYITKPLDVSTLVKVINETLPTESPEKIHRS
jgi:signal transduction histidine kinase/CheY-like chemotaxis protein